VQDADQQMSEWPLHRPARKALMICDIAPTNRKKPQSQVAAKVAIAAEPIAILPVTIIRIPSAKNQRH
jgi:hypothetical protein